MQTIPPPCLPPDAIKLLRDELVNKNVDILDYLGNNAVLVFGRPKDVFESVSKFNSVMVSAGDLPSTPPALICQSRANLSSPAML